MNKPTVPPSLDRGDIIKAASLFISSGINLSLRLQLANEDEFVDLNAAQVCEWILDRNAFLIGHFNVTLEQFEEYKQSKGYVQCCGKKRNGSPCKGWAVGKAESPKEWVDSGLVGELCPAHASE